MLKKIIFAILAFGLYQKWDKFHLLNSSLPPSMKNQGGIDPTQKRGNIAGYGALKHIPFSRVSGKDFDFPQLAVPGSFTIVDFTSDTCATCMALEPAYQKLVRMRSDVNVVRIDLPSSTGFVAENPSDFQTQKQKMEEEISQIEKTLDRFQLCGTPHVVILDPSKKVFRADVCSTKSGYDFLTSWLKKENISW